MAKFGVRAVRLPLLALDGLAREFGHVMRFGMGNSSVVFLSGEHVAIQSRHYDNDAVLQGLNAIKEFSSMEETTARPDNPTLLEMYSDGKDLGMGIGKGGPRWLEKTCLLQIAMPMNASLGGESRDDSQRKHLQNWELERKVGL